MAEAKEPQIEPQKLVYRYTSESGETSVHDANDFSDQGKVAYQKLNELSIRRTELNNALIENNVLMNFYNQIIKENDIVVEKTQEENGEDLNPMEEAIEIVDKVEKTAHEILEESGVEPVMKKKKDK